MSAKGFLPSREFHFGVQGYITVGDTREVVNYDGRIIFDSGNVDSRNRINDVCLTSLQHGDTGTILGNYGEGKGVNARAFLPVILVADQFGIAAVYTIGKDEGAGTCGILCEVIFTLLHCFRADHTNLCVLLIKVLFASFNLIVT